jgi:hypothetical protein
MRDVLVRASRVWLADARHLNIGHDDLLLTVRWIIYSEVSRSETSVQTFGEPREEHGYARADAVPYDPPMQACVLPMIAFNVLLRANLG